MGIIKLLRKRGIAAVSAAALAAASLFVPGAANFAGLTVGPIETYAASLKDVSGHWAQSYVEKAVKYEIASGYSDRTFKPDAQITRAEFTKMVNAVLGNTSAADVSFKDIDSSAWYYDEIRKGVAAAFITGDSLETFAPERGITRQEAVVILSRIVPTGEHSSEIDTFKDHSTVASWATNAFMKITAKGYISGYDDGGLHPGDGLTRAQAAKIMVDIYEKENIVRQNQTVILPEVTLNDTIYANQITVGSGVGDGRTTVENCVVLGMLNVQGGGYDNGGVFLSNSRVANAKINRSDAPVRIVAEGESTVVNSVVTDEVLLEEGDLENSGDFGRGFVSVAANRAAYLSLIGNFETVDIREAKVDVIFEEGTISNLIAEEDADRTNVTVTGRAAIDTASVYSENLMFEGDGNIEKLYVYADGVTYETEPGSITTAEEVVTPPKQVTVQRDTPLLETLAIRHVGRTSEESAYTILPVSSSDFYYYIPSEATELTVSFRAVTTEGQAGYAENPTYAVHCGNAQQQVDVSGGMPYADISVEEGTAEKRITVTVGSEKRGYSDKTYTIHLIRIAPGIRDICHENRIISDYLEQSSAASSANPYMVSADSAAIAVNLEEIANPDFVNYDIYRMTESGAELVSEGISGGNSVDLEVGYTYWIITEYRSYSDSLAGCRALRGETAYLTLSRE